MQTTDDQTSINDHNLPRFFVRPKLDFLSEDLEPRRVPETREKQQKQAKRSPKVRYAAYMRISSEEQIGNFSIDAQRRAIETWVTAKGGVLTKVYTDEGHSGRTADRPAFLRMRRDARRKQFDALIVHKFDRLARNRTDALAVKSLLRYDLGISVYSVSEPSEDSDGPMGALIEGIMESVADWYSKNLATEVAKGKKERSNQGLHNNQAPFGMIKDSSKVLIPDPKELPGLVMAFQEYATGTYSDNDIARLLNGAGYRSKTGRPFSKDTVRDLLQNQTYLGHVRYQKYERRSDGRRSFSTPVEWFEGQHEAIIDEGLFERCQAVRAERSRHRQSTAKYNHYLLRDLVYCHRCCSHPPDGKTFPNFGKMRCQAQKGGMNRYYRCRANQLGYACDQPGVMAESIDDQVIAILKNLRPPKDWRQGVTAAVSEMLGERNLEERLREITEVIQRMDMRWDHGFFTDKDEYIQQRLQLQQELEQLTPIPDDDLTQAANLLEEFGAHWERLEGKPEAQRDMVKLIVQRVYIDGQDVVAMTLSSNYHLVLGHNTNGPTDFSVDPFVYRCGSDGI